MESTNFTPSESKMNNIGEKKYGRNDVSFLAHKLRDCQNPLQIPQNILSGSPEPPCWKFLLYRRDPSSMLWLMIWDEPSHLTVTIQAPNVSMKLP